MKLTFLGTSAANAFPEAFCNCVNCQQARLLGGKSLRKRSSALVNDDLLIDLGPDIHTSAGIHKIDLRCVRYCLQTHPHADHLDASHLLSRSHEYGTVGAPRLHFYASEATLVVIAQLLARDCAPQDLFSPITGERLNLALHPVVTCKPFIAGSYLVIAFPANHDPETGALLYALQADRRTIFYGTDTAALLEETWQGFHRFKLKFDLVILDHTYGPGQPGSDHLSAQQVIEHVARMRQEGLLSEEARIFATHIAHEGNPPHPKLVQFAQAHGYDIAYDGLEILI